MSAKNKRPPFANAWFFPAAAVYGAFSVSVWALALLGHITCVPGLCMPAGHAHEMLFGYGLAVVAGFLLGPQPLPITLGLILLWLGARISYLVWPASSLATALSILFALGICIRIVPRFAPSAKKWRNQSVVWMVAALALANGIAATQGTLDLDTASVQFATLILLAGLMFFMGGRIIAPAIAGHITRQGGKLDNRVQPRLEGAVLICLLGALAGVLTESMFAFDVVGVALIAAALSTGIRLARWRVWRCPGRPDLLMLALGYGWLTIGMGLLGAARYDLLGTSVAIHALTVGALGTLTITVMGRTRLLYRFRDANVAPEAHIAGLLMSASALARIFYATELLPGAASSLLLTSAALWTLACLLIFFSLLRTLLPTTSTIQTGVAKTDFE